MHVINPTITTGAMLVSSSLLETEYPAWDGGGDYQVDDRVVYAATHSVYQRVVAGTTADAPDEDLANWVRVGPTNRWAMFDQATGTVSRAANNITFKIAPGMIRSLVLLDLNANSVTVTMRNAGNVVFTRTVNLNASVGVFDWYTYFFSPIVLKRTVVLDNLPPYANCEVEVSVNGGSSTELGSVIVGDFFDIGITEYGLSLGILDYSRKETDQFGTTTVVERAFANRMTVPVKVRRSDVDEVARRLKLVRAKAAVWIASDEFDQSVIYGFCKDWAIDMQTPVYSYLSLTIEGLT